MLKTLEMSDLQCPQVPTLRAFRSPLHSYESHCAIDDGEGRYGGIPPKKKYSAREKV